MRIIVLRRYLIDHLETFIEKMAKSKIGIIYQASHLAQFVGEKKSLKQRIHVASSALILQTNMASVFLAVPPKRSTNKTGT
ncbi:hypothetical protein TTRE_0000590001 [Trichuris trichiura]|uniref:Uncharacterized protein n=1 Tax=Trichuris trichiura TaxID=36087 RepID=A0A077ZDJ7_TRITR|nr:hypothetical protein TTRE_0000590001 [Trichuris trichiura]